MCGIAGFVAGRHRVPDAARAAECMATAAAHRGPDDAGSWENGEGVALAHRRLAILDLSSAGHQPMRSASGRYTIVYNGEIYNHLALRERLFGVAWRGHSDTETLLAAIEAWGVERALREVVGMFAFALWDGIERRLILARDRFGEKPLFYGWCGDTFVFASEIKSLRAFPGWRGEIDRSALASFMRCAYVPTPHSIYRGIRKLPPGTFLALGTGQAVGSWPAPQTYWSARDAASRDKLEQSSDGGATDELQRLLGQAIRRQMIADVPLGAFLSGGIDSSTVVALMQAQSARPVQTFTIGFTEADYDEAVHARAIAVHLGTDHTELRVTPQDAMAVIPRLPDIYDEPFGDSSGIPTHIVARLARGRVAVSLSGDGGDELFGGYNRYSWGPSIWNRIGSLPASLRRGAGAAVTLVSPGTWDRIGSALPRRLRQPTLGDRLHKLAGVIDAATPDDLYYRLISQQRERKSLVVGATEADAWADAELTLLGQADFAERMMFHDLVGYLTDDILAKVDRAAMAVSLETRVPMLDQDLVDFASRLPPRMKIRDGQGKWLLRQVLYRHVPKALIERPKQGFGIPLDSWLRGPLRDWSEALLDASRLRSEGYLRPEVVREKWSEHLSGRRNWQHWLWNVLMFQAWLERWEGAGK